MPRLPPGFFSKPAEPNPGEEIIERIEGMIGAPVKRVYVNPTGEVAHLVVNGDQHFSLKRSTGTGSSDGTAHLATPL
jgi:hypothetical protein